MSFINKVVLVTGGSSGIGAATAILFAKEGADVAIVGRNEEKLKSVAAKIESVGKKPLVIKADVAKDEEVKDIVKQTVDKFGKLDVLVNNAGISRPGKILDGNSIMENYDTVMATNLRAVIHLTTLAAPHLVASKGNIVNISSVASLRCGGPSVIAYQVSKAGLDHFTRGAAIELAPLGVRVNSINPGPVRTDIIENSRQASQTPGKITWDDMKQFTLLNRVGEPEEIAELVVFVASDKARSITGSVFVSDNGTLLR